MSVDNILNIVQSLSEEPNKLSEDEEVDLYLYFTSSKCLERILSLGQ